LGALEAVLRGVADIAPIDSYAFSLLGMHRPDLIARVRVVGSTTPTPIPPLVASRSGADGSARAALSLALIAAHTDDTLKPLLEGLLLQRFVQPDPAGYDLLKQRFVATTAYWREHPLAAATHAAFSW
jgi:ABC-type phosphate/phosphonate transport system substrate-binding protein